MFLEISPAELAQGMQCMSIAVLDLATAPKTMSVPILYNQTVESIFGKVSTMHSMKGVVMNLDLAVPSFGGKAALGTMARFIEAPRGRIKALNALMLSSVAPGKTFQLFSLLPRELRAKVWQLAPEVRMIKATEIAVKSPFSPNDGENRATWNAEWVIDYDIEPARRPAAMGACKEASDDILLAGMYKPMLQVLGGSKVVYFNPELDVLHLTSDNIFRLCLVHALRNPSEIANIKKVYIDMPDFTDYRAWVVENLRMMPGVELLKLGGTFNISRRATEKNLNISFQNLLGDKVELTPVVKLPSGGEARNAVAMRVAMTNIVGKDNKQYIMDVWKMVDECWKGSENFPERIDISLQFCHVRTRN